MGRRGGWETFIMVMKVDLDPRKRREDSTVMVPHWLPLLTHLKPSETDEGGPFERKRGLLGSLRRCE